MFTSDLPDVPVGGSTVPAVILEACRQHPTDVAILDDRTGRPVTFAELAHQIDRIGAALSDRNARTGDVVAIWAPNCPEWQPMAIGAMAAGYSVTGVSPPSSDEEVERQLTMTKASLLATTPDLLDRARRICSSGPVNDIVVLGDIEETTRDGDPVVVGFDDLLRSKAASPDLASVWEDDIAILPTSSGTTGRPKLVEITHCSMVTMFRQISASLPVGRQDRVLVLPSFAHAMGMVLCGTWPLSHGACLVTTPKFNPERFLPAIAEHKLTVVVVPPLLAGFVAGHPAATTEALASVRLLGFGGAPSSPEILQTVANRFPQIVVGQGYGMTELTCVATTVRSDDPGPVGSVGRLVPNTEARIVDPESGRDLSVDEVGELWIRGPQIMARYRGEPERTAATVDEDGWLHTGDRGRIDGDGNVFIDGRYKELIKSKGYQVAPAELEHVLLGHPAVVDAAVTGMDVGGGDERPIAFVVRTGGDSPSEEEIGDWVSERVAPYKRLKRIEFVEAIPRNAHGKILRRALPVVTPV